MRPDVKRIILNRMKEDHRDYGDYNDYGDYARGGRRDMIDSRDMRNMGDGRDMRDDYEDERRGVRGSGRRRRDRADGHFFDDDDEEYEKPLRLPRKIRTHWLHNLVSKDGHRGPRFREDEVMTVADKMRIGYEDYTEADIYLMTNVLYSDLCKSFKSVIPPDKEIWHWVSAAQEWLEDDDSRLTGSNKVVSYYYNVVNG